MNPEQPVPDYSFITDGNQPSGGGFLANKSAKQRKLIVLAGAGALLLFLVMLFALIFGGPNPQTERLVNIAQKQQEIVRIATIGESKARGDSARNLAVTTRASVQSSQATTLGLIANQGRKLERREIDMARNSRTDTTLEQAEQSNRFDEVFVDTMKTMLTEYRQQLSVAFNETKSRTTKEVLADMFEETNLLLGD
jgi:hypothetical protein